MKSLGIKTLKTFMVLLALIPVAFSLLPILTSDSYYDNSTHLADYIKSNETNQIFFDAYSVCLLKSNDTIDCQLKAYDYIEKLDLKGAKRAFNEFNELEYIKDKVSRSSYIHPIISLIDFYLPLALIPYLIFLIKCRKDASTMEITPSIRDTLTNKALLVLASFLISLTSTIAITTTSFGHLYTNSTTTIQIISAISCVSGIAYVIVNFMISQQVESQSLNSIEPIMFKKAYLALSVSTITAMLALLISIVVIGSSLEGMFLVYCLLPLLAYLFSRTGITKKNITSK